MFRLHTVAQKREREDLLESMNRNTKSPHPTELSECQLTQLTTYSKFANISKFKVSVVLGHLAKLLHHSHMSKFTGFIYTIKPVTRHESILFTFGSSCVGHWCTGLNFPIWLKFPLKDFSSLNSLALSVHPQMKNKIMKNALSRIFTTVKIELKINDEVEIKEKVITSELLKN